MSGRAWGIELENRLQSRLSSILGEQLNKTPGRYDKVDFEGDNYLVELKGRRAPYKPDSFDKWLLPYCKGFETNKTIIYFYYFEATDELFMTQYDKEIFSKYEVEANNWGQKHYLIPAMDWRKVEV